ncbi:Hypothetical protein R9X50_00681400 [Acrodontium crateriforme]|uniref:WW domain-containing protein n=1 Tax=Acrodontium crateriforme TaxID=150365 RepID=A0AAQ3RBT2_9PEZI|nr:Hypothetical protein R9X50_00681400 [Acrodontium crateriforme]
MYISICTTSAIHSSSLKINLMAEDNDSNVKEAAGQPLQTAESSVKESPEPAKSQESEDLSAAEKPQVAAQDVKEGPATEDGEVPQEDSIKNSKSSEDYKWCKCFYTPDQHGVQNFYFLHTVTQESSWEEPNEPYWLWDTANNCYDASGLQIPSSKQPQSSSGVSNTGSANASSEQDPGYYGYNPKIHGSYDPNAPYAQYHSRKRAEESGAQASGDSPAINQPEYLMQGTFNRFTGAFQTADRSVERHNDYNKSGRQLNAFFDVDAAANSHDGRSLKEERRSQKLSKKEIAELSKRRREKKEKKRMDFYKS